MWGKRVERWLHRIFLSLAVVLCLLRFAYLRADFPNHSPWIMDQAKFTDEGWWANAAVRHFVVGHWQIAGDYNPAIAVPVWPLLLTVVFHFSGVGIVAARAVNVFFSIATVGLVYLLVRRYASETAAALAALLLAASPFAFAFSRLGHVRHHSELRVLPAALDRVLRKPTANLAIHPPWLPYRHLAIHQDHGSCLNAGGSMVAMDGN